MNKVLILNGSPHQHGCTATALDEMIKVFEEEGRNKRYQGLHFL